MSAVADRITEITTEIGEYPDVRKPIVGACLEAAKTLQAHRLDLAKTAAELKIDETEAHARAVIGLRLRVDQSAVLPLPRKVPVGPHPEEPVDADKPDPMWAKWPLRRVGVEDMP